MKTIFAHRLNEINLTNRFQSLYDTKENKNLKILDFGIGQDNSIISKKAIEILNDSSTNYNNWKYAENGENSLINSFIKFAFKQYEVRLNNDEITLSMGIKEVLNSLAFILINPNDLVVSTTPGYNVFQRKAKMLGGVIKELVINNENNYLPNIFSIEENELKKIKVVLLNYPNNPTGAKCSREYVSKLVKLANKYDFYIINDGAYIDLSGEDKPFSFLSVDKERIIELYSASKTFGMTGARLGFVAGSKTIINMVKKYRDQENSGQFIPLQLAYKYCLDYVDTNKIKEKYINRSKILIDIMNKLGFKGDSYSGAFYLFFKVPNYFDNMLIKDANEFAFLIKKKYSILIVPYSNVNYFRMSLTYKNESDPYILYNRLKECNVKY